MFHLLKLIFWMLIFVLALSFFGISIQAIVTSPAGQENFHYLSELVVRVVDWISARL